MPFVHRIDNIRFGEFDLGGVLYHANYFHLYEEAREAFLRSIGHPYSKIMDDRAHLAIAEAHQEFLRPVRFGTGFSISLSTAELKRSSFRFVYEFSTADQPLHRAWTRMVYVQDDATGFRPTALPEPLRTSLSALS
ncbi:MAG: acyl-CoA thioesterase [Deltaproteobacteria bacterium]|nr:acyl-CoA thioesterase [Deltaproteobacteria bacterium]